MKIVTAEQMRALDRAAIEERGIPSLDLMDRAGRGLADLALAVAGGRGPIAVVAGRGNNGGDGFVAARLLRESGADAFVVLVADPKDLSADAKVNRDRFAEAGGEIASDLDGARLGGCACVIDALLGTGLARDVRGELAGAIEAINSAGAPVVACDIPSGLNADDGRVMGAAVKARATATFGLPKLGLYVGYGTDHAGRVSVIDIGIPEDLVRSLEVDVELIEPSMFAGALTARKPSSHKGSFGHVVVFAGSGGHLGAGYLASMAALRAGCGLCTYCLPMSSFDKFDARYPEIMCDPIPDDGAGAFGPAGVGRAVEICGGKGALAIGPAVGTSDATRTFVNGLLARTGITAVVDADGLNVLDAPALQRRKGGAVLTPHPGEMSRLLRSSIEEVQADRLGAARRLARESGCITVLKGAGTVVAEPGGLCAINPTGNPGMASAGMGDALTGIVASLIAQGTGLREAAMAAMYVHGLAGDMAAEELGEAAVVATDVIGILGRAMERAT